MWPSAPVMLADEINGEPTASVPYRAALAVVFHVVGDGAARRLGRRY